MKFRKKPVVIDAIQWTGNSQDLNAHEISKWASYRVMSDKAFFNTLEGEMCARPGDWIIRGIQGEIYPCKPDIFEATYEAVE